MSYNVTIKFTAQTVAAIRLAMYDIAPQFVVNDSYVEHIDHVNGAYPANNMTGNNLEMARSLEDYLGAITAHAGVVTALRNAIIAEDGTYTLTVDNANDKMYYEELGRTLAKDGFEITVAAQNDIVIKTDGE